MNSQTLSAPPTSTSGIRRRWVAAGLCALTLGFAIHIWSERDGRQQYADLGVCSLANGQSIYGCRLGFRTWGRLNPDRSNAVLFPTWFAGSSRDVAGLVGHDKMLDPSKYFIVAVDSLANGVSASPSNSQSQHGPSFPAFSISDMVEADHRLLTEVLRISHLHAVAGFSMDGMQAFEWVTSRPSFIDTGIAIEGSPRLADSDLALWRSEEAAMQNDPAWHNGSYSNVPALPSVMAIHNRFLSSLRSSTSPAENANRMPIDANDWRAQEEAMIHLDAAHGKPLILAATDVHTRLLIIVNPQYKMVDPAPAEEFALGSGARLVVMDSDCGHKALICEMPQITNEVRSFLDR